METRVIRKVSWQIVPFVALCYFVCYLDRVNVGFAALQMNSDLGFTATVFGWGAGIFFFGYFFFEVPSNLALERFGARLWIARIMVTWGLLSAAMALVWNESSFLVIRFLLGAAEAGFFPGIILFLTYWFPAAYRARMVGRFMAAIPISAVIGSPVSGLILGMDGIWGLKGWQWLFICEGLPTVLLGLVVMLYLTDGPEKANWLDTNERVWLIDRLRRERMVREAHAKHTLWEALKASTCAHTQPRLLWHCRGQLRFGLLAADDRQKLRRQRSPDRVHHCRPLRGGSHRCGDLAASFGPYAGAQVEYCSRFSGRRRRLGAVDLLPGSCAKDDRAFDRRDRNVCDRTVILDAAYRVPEWHRRCRRHRPDQLDRQSRRLCGTLRDGLSKGRDRRV